MKISDKELSDAQVDEVFTHMCDNGDSLNFLTFESFISGHGDKVID